MYVERMWLVMRNLSQWRAADVERLAEESAEIVEHYIKTLESGGNVHRIGGTDSAPIYQVLVDQVAAPAEQMPEWVERAHMYIDELAAAMRIDEYANRTLDIYRTMTEMIAGKIRESFPGKASQPEPSRRRRLSTSRENGRGSSSGSEMSEETPRFSARGLPDRVSRARNARTKGNLVESEGFVKWPE